MTDFTGDFSLPEINYIKQYACGCSTYTYKNELVSLLKPAVRPCQKLTCAGAIMLRYGYRNNQRLALLANEGSEVKILTGE